MWQDSQHSRPIKTQTGLSNSSSKNVIQIYVEGLLGAQLPQWSHPPHSRPAWDRVIIFSFSQLEFNQQRKIMTRTDLYFRLSAQQLGAKPLYTTYLYIRARLLNTMEKQYPLREYINPKGKGFTSSLIRMFWADPSYLWTLSTVIYAWIYSNKIINMRRNRRYNSKKKGKKSKIDTRLCCLCRTVHAGWKWNTYLGHGPANGLLSQAILDHRKYSKMH